MARWPASPCRWRCPPHPPSTSWTITLGWRCRRPSLSPPAPPLPNRSHRRRRCGSPSLFPGWRCHHPHHAPSLSAPSPNCWW
ncbi:MAG: hypothetical protein TH68_04220 [Candidatus Synechococcus spongiarum 142]|uniref:Uncharacterized protein n=1 Tax=Candidatus Synechococcus spongiarum 142 TaxID=1608213 RepID=A0A6N3X8W2_9SYNE|nr:MAG: hypothetical protein TH68_04220 [Candidatus Synechococcus spongiarum 142]